MKKLIWLTDLHLVEPGQDLPQGVDPLARLRVCLEDEKRFVDLSRSPIWLGEEKVIIFAQDEQAA